MDKKAKDDAAAYAADHSLDRRVKLMAARDLAIKAGDWNLMNEICRRLAKLPIPTVRR